MTVGALLFVQLLQESAFLETLSDAVDESRDHVFVRILRVVLGWRNEFVSEELSHSKTSAVSDQKRTILKELGIDAGGYTETANTHRVGADNHCRSVNQSHDR